MAVAVSAGSAFAGVANEFGTLTDGYGAEISFDAGSGNSNTDFVYQNYSNNGGSLNMGLSTQFYYSSANGPVTNDGADTFYTQAGADQSGNPSATAGAGRWGFKWSVTYSDEETGKVGVPEGYFMALRIEGPSGGSWGSLDQAYSSELIGYPGSANNYANQNVWVPAYDFMQVDSASQGGAPGAWSGLGYDFDELGTYSVSIAIWDNTSGNMDTVGTLSMDVVVEGSVVPGVGGLAALGGLGLVGRRRRR
jgi:hypothetical protein